MKQYSFGIRDSNKETGKIFFQRSMKLRNSLPKESWNIFKAEKDRFLDYRGPKGSCGKMEGGQDNISYEFIK